VCFNGFPTPPNDTWAFSHSTLLQDVSFSFPFCKTFSTARQDPLEVLGVVLQSVFDCRSFANFLLCNMFPVRPFSKEELTLLDRLSSRPWRNPRFPEKKQKKWTFWVFFFSALHTPFLGVFFSYACIPRAFVTSPFSRWCLHFLSAPGRRDHGWSWTALSFFLITSFDPLGDGLFRPMAFFLNCFAGWVSAFSSSPFIACLRAGGVPQITLTTKALDTPHLRFFQFLPSDTIRVFFEGQPLAGNVSGPPFPGSNLSPFLFPSGSTTPSHKGYHRR